MSTKFLVLFSVLFVCGKTSSLVENDGNNKQVRVRRMWADDEPPRPAKDEAELFEACDDGNLDRVRSILTSGMRSRYHQPFVDVNIKFDYYRHGKFISANKYFYEGTTPLMTAARRGHLWIVEFLTRRRRLAGGVRVDEKDSLGWTALMHAAREGHYSVVRLLARPPIKANVNEQANDGQTALMLAAQHNHYRVVELLVQETNVYVNTKDRDGMTALMFASREGRYDIVRFLAQPPHQRGVDVNAQDNRGRTALAMAGTGYGVSSDDRYKTMDILRKCEGC